jgi:hypothetical protein
MENGISGLDFLEYVNIFDNLKKDSLWITQLTWSSLRPPAKVTHLWVQLLIYKTVLKPIWTYGIQLRGTASNSNMEILESFQSKFLRMIVDTPWYVTNTVIRRDLQIPTVKEEIRSYSSQYSVRLSAHPQDLTVNLIVLPDNRRLRRHLPNDVPIRFLV